MFHVENCCTHVTWYLSLKKYHWLGSISPALDAWVPVKNALSIDQILLAIVGHCRVSGSWSGVSPLFLSPPNSGAGVLLAAASSVCGLQHNVKYKGSQLCRVDRLRMTQHLWLCMDGGDSLQLPVSFCSLLMNCSMLDFCSLLNRLGVFSLSTPAPHWP